MENKVEEPKPQKEIILDDIPEEEIEPVDNSEYSQKYYKDYYQKNKEKIKQKYIKEAVLCEVCGQQYRGGQAQHEETKKHQIIERYKEILQLMSELIELNKKKK